MRKLPKIYCYASELELNIGQLVVVDLRGMECCGVIVPQKAQEQQAFAGKIKDIKLILPYRLPASYVEFLFFAVAYTISDMGAMLRLIVPFNIAKLCLPEKRTAHAIEVDHLECQIKLNIEQKAAVNCMQKFSSSFKVFLLHGITGSGKTEVFLDYAKNLVIQGKQILILVPEVSLSMELAKKTAQKFQNEVFIWHNSISLVKKLSIWKKAINNEKIAIVGARSALFIPFPNLGAIIVDEEHDKSFKQEEGIIYNARDMAIYLASCLNIPIILSSATPSVESYNHAKNGKYEYITLKSRFFKNAALPDIYIDDLKKKKNKLILSENSIAAITACLDIKKQALIFINRRGHTPKILCRDCGAKIGCPACSAWLCYHMIEDQMICHYCGFQTLLKGVCRECNSDNVIGVGAGIEKVAEEMAILFPECRILALSSDTMNTPKKISQAMAKINNFEVDIILGTQILAKGHNFKNLNLVVITCIDLMLSGEDFRSMERAFQLMYQVAGRAGRFDNDHKSKVIVQTYNPNEELMEMLKYNNIEKMYTAEIHNRKIMKMPPFGRLVGIVISALSESEIWQFAEKFVQAAPDIRNFSQQIKILGPMQPAMFKIRSRFRLRMMIISTSYLQEYIKKWLNNIKVPNNIRLRIDVDPYDFF